MKRLTQLIFLTTTFAVSNLVQAEAPLIFSKLIKTTDELKQTECLEQAEVALKSTGFVENFAKYHNAVWGINTETSGHIRCVFSEEITSEPVILFVVSGTDYENSLKLLRELENNF